MLPGRASCHCLERDKPKMVPTGPTVRPRTCVLLSDMSCVCSCTCVRECACSCACVCLFVCVRVCACVLARPGVDPVAPTRGAGAGSGGRAPAADPAAAHPRAVPAGGGPHACHCLGPRRGTRTGGGAFVCRGRRGRHRGGGSVPGAWGEAWGADSACARAWRSRDGRLGGSIAGRPCSAARCCSSAHLAVGLSQMAAAYAGSGGGSGSPAALVDDDDDAAALVGHSVFCLPRRALAVELASCAQRVQRALEQGLAHPACLEGTLGQPCPLASVWISAMGGGGGRWAWRLPSGRTCWRGEGGGVGVGAECTLGVSVSALAGDLPECRSTSSCPYALSHNARPKCSQAMRWCGGVLGSAADSGNWRLAVAEPAVAHLFHLWRMAVYQLGRLRPPSEATQGGAGG
jgi:hypothetical protein